MTFPDHVALAREVREEAIQMQEWLWSHGWDVTLNRVLKHHRWFKRWWHKQLAFGYLVNRLGLKRRPGWEQY